MQVYSFIITLCLTFAVDGSLQSANVIAAALIHELGHGAAILLSGGRISSVVSVGIGGNIRYSSSVLSCGREAFVYALGPCFGAVLCLIAKKWGFPGLFRASYGLTAVNLLPAIPLDGGYLLKSLLPFEKSGIILTVSGVLSGLFCCLSGLLIIARGGSFSLFLVGIVIFVCLARKNGIE